MNRLKILFLPFTFFSCLLFGQQVDTVPTPFILDENLQRSNPEVVKRGNRLLYLHDKDTIFSYLAINRKIIKSNNSIFYLEWNGGEQIVEEKNNEKTIFTSPLVSYYDDFIDIPKSWDIDKNFWALDAVGLKAAGGSPFCTGVDGYLKRIPLKDIDSWTGNLFIKKVPRYDLYDVTQSLPINSLFYDKYFIKQLEKKKRDEAVITYADVENSVIKETFFDFLVTSKGEMRYLLCHDKKLLMWQLNEKTSQWEQKISIPFDTNGYFTCFEFKNVLYMVDFEGVIFKINEKSIEKIKVLPEKLLDIALVIDKDAGTIGYVEQNDIQGAASISKIISEKVINIFK